MAQYLLAGIRKFYTSKPPPGCRSESLGKTAHGNNSAKRQPKPFSTCSTTTWMVLNRVKLMNFALIFMYIVSLSSWDPRGSFWSWVHKPRETRETVTKCGHCSRSTNVIWYTPEGEQYYRQFHFFGWFQYKQQVSKYKKPRIDSVILKLDQRCGDTCL